jgi:hypothetical protein
LIPRFTAVVWLGLPAELRLARIEARELARYGAARLEEGGDLAGVYEKFKVWALNYDQPDQSAIRSRTVELQWLSALSCPVWQSEEDLTATVLTKWLEETIII